MTPARITSALGAWVVSWGRKIAELLTEDGEWGTTTMRPRLHSFTSAAGRSDLIEQFRREHSLPEDV